tara:strand:+ start:142 stop:522 length:381 start_codon:yes stop_codon:yes gene_type:complete
MSVFRKTKTVKMLLNLFYQQNNAISVVELISKFSKKMNKTTVYRILSRLEKSGHLHSFTDKNGLKRYAKGDQRIRSREKPILHPHFLCEDCGISTCLPIEITKPSVPNLTINSSEQLYLGQCNDCH